MKSEKTKTSTESKKTAKLQNFIQRERLFYQNQALEKTLGRGFLKNVKKFKSALLGYLENPAEANIEEIIRLAKEAGYDTYPEIVQVGDQKFNSYYELLLKGPRDKFYYSQFADVLFEWGEVESAIELLNKGASILNDKELHDKRDLFITYATYVGNSSAELRSLILEAARNDLDITIEGETGTGKEVVANLIHRLSSRKNKDLVAFSCAEFPATLLQSELFGREKGAFTGAQQSKKGLFEKASGGILFLDELTSLDIYTQAALLRTLQERDVKPLGQTERKKLDVRVLFGIGGDTMNLMKEGEIRKDLFYRIATFTIPIPPLRERKGDILELTEYFLNKFNQQYGKQVVISRPVLKILQEHDWPGNVRELENLLRVAISTANEKEITLKHIFRFLKYFDKAHQVLKEAVTEWWTKKKLIEKYQDIVLEDCGGKISKASKILGVAASTLRRGRSKTQR